MASPSVDGAAVTATQGAGTSKALPALTTAVANDLIVVFVAVSQNATVPTVTSVSSSHLTFNKRANHQHPSGSPNTQTEIWTARASGTLASEVITVSLSGAPDCWVIAAQAFQNVVTANFDPNASLPAVSDGSGATSCSGVSTTNPDDLLIGSWSFTSQPAPSPPAGWTTIAGPTSLLGGGFSTLLCAYKSVSLTQSAITVTTAAGAGNYAEIIDALTNDVALLPLHRGVIVGM